MFRHFFIRVVMVMFVGTSSIGAQTLMIGAGASYGSDIEQFAPNFRLYYGINENICFGPEFSYFPSKNKDGYDIQLNEYGFVVHYIFDVKEKAGIYPLAGLSYSVEKETMYQNVHVDEAFGVSIGLGSHVNLGNFLPYVEYKYITGELSQSTFSVGLIYHMRFNMEIKTE